jgi:hypothetical protein
VAIGLPPVPFDEIWCKTVSKPNIKSFELDPKELGGLAIEDIKCRACSGYGNCGYRQYRLLDGKPILFCQARKEQLLKERQGGDK